MSKIGANFHKFSLNRNNYSPRICKNFRSISSFFASTTNCIQTLFISFIAGCCLTLAFAPFQFSGIAFLSPALLLFLWLQSSTPKKVMLQGFLFGVGFFSTGTSWVYISIHNFGNAPIWLALFITILMILFLSLYPALQGYLLRRLYAHRSATWICLGLFPATWVLFEWLRSTVFSGFPWLLLGSSQTNTPLKGYAALFGVYGMSFLVALISGCFVLLAIKEKKNIKILSIIIIFVIIGLGGFSSKIIWTKPTQKPLQVSLIQGNISQSLKWNPEQANRTLNIYKSLTEKNWESDLIIWPEAAAPIFYQQAPYFFQALDAQAKAKNRNLLIGMPFISADQKNIYNGMLLLGNSSGEYLKRHLVPFGEYLPLSKLFSWILQFFQIPLSDLSPGPAEQSPLVIDNLRIAPFICYEIAFPNEVLLASENSQFIVVLIDDSWFGDSIALQQHLQISQMRALETQRYVLLATNTGITAFITPKGQISAIAPTDRVYVLTSMMTPMTEKTPLMLWRYFPVFIVVVILLILGRIKIRRT